MRSAFLYIQDNNPALIFFGISNTIIYYLIASHHTNQQQQQQLHSMTITLQINAEESENLTALSEHCGVSAEKLALVFLTDGINSYKSQQNELRDNLEQ